MSFASRGLRSSHSHAKTASRTRRALFIFAVLLGLFLLGTVIVLGTVKVYFGVPQAAMLTEAEVPWDPEHVIPRLHGSVGPPLPGDLPAASTTATTAKRAAEEWEEEDDDDEQPPKAWESSVNEDGEPLAAAIPTSSASDDTWGIDGKGSGGYWMRSDWDGVVEDSNHWAHLYNVSLLEGEKMPRIIHQTWKSKELPEKWRVAWRQCREGMPDYTFMLWTDDMSREFIAQNYPESLEMFDGYPYPIQRADAIRYFLLHHFGGIYMDLDIGCRRRIDPLLSGEWDALLPITAPVGVSNDLLVATKGNEFFKQTIDNLKSFNHNYIMPYATVMFSTGPMMLSANRGVFARKHAQSELRVLPTSLYGKNALYDAVPHSFFAHLYGSSWHADDAGFITWLGRWGKNLMIVGGVVLVLLSLRLLWSKATSPGGLRSVFNSRDQQYQLLPVLGSIPESGRSSPVSLGSSGPMSPTIDQPTTTHHFHFTGALRRAGNFLLAAPAIFLPTQGRRQRGWLFFAPTAFQPQHGRRRTASEASQLPLRRPRDSSRATAPPPYERTEAVAADGMEEVDAFLKQADDEAGGSHGGATTTTAGGNVAASSSSSEWNSDWKNPT